jgi:hypothetical protein
VLQGGKSKDVVTVVGWEAAILAEWRWFELINPMYSRSFWLTSAKVVAIMDTGYIVRCAFLRFSEEFKLA